uniref:C-type lectin domain-containing protein n=1 Tax=Aquila chrysaetos chrysaetos TaxID=223781 RepID=A0A663F1V5_AQUCH
MCEKIPYLKHSSKLKQVKHTFSKFILISHDYLHFILKAKIQTLSPHLAVLHFLKMITASGGKIFATSEKKADFHTTLTKCKEAGGSIATPRNPDENDAILYFVKTFNTYAYLGLKECLIPSRFQFLGSTQLSYTNWHLNEPSGKGEEECVEMYTDGTWNDKSCNKNRLIVCQF